MTETMSLAMWYSGALWAQADGDPLGVSLLIRHLIAAAVFSLMGIVIFGASVWVLARLLPFSMRKEIEEDQNMALGVIIAGLFVGIALIIAAAIVG
jgi:putative membrane protein